MRRIAAVITARPSYSRVKTVLKVLQASPDIDLKIITSGSALLPRYGVVRDQMEADGLTPDIECHTTLEGESLLTSARSTGIALSELASVFHDLQPAGVITIADRYETAATAIAASYQNIPLLHLQGGEVTGNIDEKVRHAITKIADLHFVSTPIAYQRLCKMGEDPRKVFVTGCPSIDLAKLAYGQLPPPLPSGLGPDIDVRKPYIIIMQHPVTTEYGAAYAQTQATLGAILDRKLRGYQMIWFWPNVDSGSDGTSRALNEAHERDEPICFRRNLPPDVFLKLLGRAACIVGNSSVAIREGSYLGTPAVNIGTRQMGREMAGNVTSCDYDTGEIRRTIVDQLSHGPYRVNRLYGDGESGPRIAALIATEELTFDKKLAY